MVVGTGVSKQMLLLLVKGLLIKNKIQRAPWVYIPLCEMCCSVIGLEVAWVSHVAKCCLYNANKW